MPGDEKKDEIPLEKKRAPNRLVVDEATNDDNSVVALSMEKMESCSSSVATRCLSRASVARMPCALYSRTKIAMAVTSV